MPKKSAAKAKKISSEEFSSPARAIVVFILVGLIVILTVSGTFTNLYRSIFPTSELKALNHIESSLPLPKPTTLTTSDRGCYKPIGIEPTEQCVRNKIMEYDNFGYALYPKLDSYLRQQGWAAIPSSHNDVKASISGNGAQYFTFSKKDAVNGQLGCVSGYRSQFGYGGQDGFDTEIVPNNPVAQLYIVIYGPTQSSGTCF